jgi:hypothetical protein
MTSHESDQGPDPSVDSADVMAPATPGADALPVAHDDEDDEATSETSAD